MYASAARQALTGLVLTAALAWAGFASAADGEAPGRLFGAPAVAEVAPTPAGGLAQVTLSLAVVLAAVFVAAWLMKRLRGARPGAAGDIRVVAEQALGSRERVVLLEVGGERLLVGVAPGSVRALHALRPAAPTGE
jgi:flagellar protein FliO/FliZ